MNKISLFRVKLPRISGTTFNIGFIAGLAAVLVINTINILRF
jgi:hypothetical protein